MLQRLPLWILTGCLALLFSFSTAAQDITKLDHSRITGDALTKRIRQLMDTAKVTGLSISVFNHNEPVYTRAFGYAQLEKGQKMDTSTVFWACSFSKSVFAYCVMKLVESNIIHLDTPLVHYLSKPLPDYVFTKKTRGYQDIKDDKRYERITARMCLDHTTGFPNYRGFEDDGKLRIKSDPGTHYSYSGEGMYLLQFVLEQITGKSYEILAQEEVFRPLGMSHTSYIWQEAFNADHCVGHDSLQKGYEFDERTSPHAAGSMYCTIGDMSVFWKAMLQRKGLPKKDFKEMFQSQIPILSKQEFGPNARVDDKDITTTPLSYGLGVGLLKTPFGTAFFKEGHSEGWGHYAIAWPDKGLAIIIMTNSDQGESIFKPLLETAIGDIYTPWFWMNYIPFDQKRG